MTGDQWCAGRLSKDFQPTDMIYRLPLSYFADYRTDAEGPASAGGYAIWIECNGK